MKVKNLLIPLLLSVLVATIYESYYPVEKFYYLGSKKIEISESEYRTKKIQNGAFNKYQKEVEFNLTAFSRIFLITFCGSTLLLLLLLYLKNLPLFNSSHGTKTTRRKIEKSNRLYPVLAKCKNALAGIFIRKKDQNSKKKIKEKSQQIKTYDPNLKSDGAAICIGVLIFLLSIAMHLNPPVNENERSFLLFFIITSRVLVIIWIISLAKKRNRPLFGWILFGLILPPVGLIAIATRKKILHLTEEEAKQKRGEKIPEKWAIKFVENSKKDTTTIQIEKKKLPRLLRRALEEDSKILNYTLQKENIKNYTKKYLSSKYPVYAAVELYSRNESIDSDTLIGLNEYINAKFDKSDLIKLLESLNKC